VLRVLRALASGSSLVQESLGQPSTDDARRGCIVSAPGCGASDAVTCGSVSPADDPDDADDADPVPERAASVPPLDDVGQAVLRHRAEEETSS